jgi:aryl-alcohol dehydrogenase-like predicted oxidoreductase
MLDERLFLLMERQRELGKVGSIGVSCDDLQTALAAVGHPVVEIVQFTLSDDPACREVLETAMRRGKVSLVRGIARRAVQQDRCYEDGLAAGFLSAMALPSVAGVIVGTIDVRHLRSNAEALSVLMRKLEVSS